MCSSLHKLRLSRHEIRRSRYIVYSGGSHIPGAVLLSRERGAASEESASSWLQLACALACGFTDKQCWACSGWWMDVVLEVCCQVLLLILTAAKLRNA